MYLEDDQQQQPQQERIPQSAEEYAEAYKQMREKYVPKEMYEKAKEDNKALVKALSGEGPIPEGVQEKAKPADVKQLRKEFLEAGETNLSNAQYVKKALELRKAVIAEGGMDPFLPSGAKATPTPKDIEGAQKTADALQSWLDAATDETGKVDDDLFNAYLKRGLAEDSPLITARLKAHKKAQA